MNKAIIIGRLGQDPELRTTPSGVHVCNFSLATSEKYKDKSGEYQEKTEWHSCTAWGKAGEIIAKYQAKGNQLYVEGKIETRSYDKDGQKHYKTGINVKEFQFLDSKPSGSEPNQQGEGLPF